MLLQHAAGPGRHTYTAPGSSMIRRTPRTSSGRRSRSNRPSGIRPRLFCFFASASSSWTKDRISCLFMHLLYHMVGFYAIISVLCCLYQVLYRNYSLDAILHFCIMLLITFRIVNSVPLGSTNMTNAFFDW